MIQINNLYEIDSCEDCVVLNTMATKKKGDNIGERYVKRPRYYPNLEQTLEMLIDLDVQSDGLKSFEYITKRQADIKSDILGVMNDLIQAEIQTLRGVQAYKNKKA